jgi:threonyl-tRNA synthetase
MGNEIQEIIRFCKAILSTLGFNDLTYYLSTRPEGSVGDPSRWEEAENALRKALEMQNITNYQVDQGGGAFYGPKIDIKIKDALGREWQLSTIQFDFNLPERFDMTYIGPDGNKHQPYMIHRALLGSLERFFGILIEHYAGKFPFWLSPEQFRILTINDSEATLAHAKSIFDQLKTSGFRGTLDDRNEKLGLKIREAQIQHIPFGLVIGDKEAEAGQVALRKRGEQATALMSVNDVLSLFNELESKKVN